MLPRHVQRKLRSSICTPMHTRSMAYWSEEDKAERAQRARELQDVVIVGGGIVGSALACNLKSNPVFHGKKVTVIEPSPPNKLDDANAPLGIPDARVYTITPASKKLFEAIGVWDKIKPEHIAPFGHMQVWDAMGDGFIRFDAAKAQVKNGRDLGYVLEHGVLQRALALRMEELASQDDPNPLQVLSPAEVRNFEGPGEVQRAGIVHLEDGREIRSRLVVAADGGKSMIRKLSALGTWGWTYDQQAVVATVKTDQINTTAWQRFLPSGPIALLPLRDGYSSVVWSTNENHAIELKSISPEEFVAELNEALNKPSETPSPPQIPILGNLFQGIHLAAQTVLAAGALADPFQSPPKATEAVGRRVSFPLKLQHATRYSKYGVALIGDSAHSIHPLAGQGLNLGLADVTSLGNLLSQGVQAGVHLGDEQFLQNYDNDRKKANISMALAMDGFKNLFGPAPDAVLVARNVGMSSLNAVDPVKTQIMKYAMGL
ncbi:ubiquinone biosynthesis monooxygenase COQ6 [Aphanomyces invadans]|uniref:Ubiquinone biosynthesis monooxygenase COQ6, mitochondrial n=1 Tax=Aphanomyces invadans TaxID=157072 RepID=A0A024U7F0_9STRA|nr:ubiquinone biosynthesis monooxygenase COQ6 [Aphanomyces invadans]ETW02150.1 ubiquinone biosynthesis monooxygenase COQ6 [Aphanomyces invadans]|eukprot:XP_008868755.1 ubiquinone biosynthesis monooxygenase COQ6 [Aphanomyces invadans]